MDIGATMAVAASSSTDSIIAASMLASTEQLMSVEADVMMASLGMGINVNAVA